MNNFNPISYIKEVGGVLKFGSGVLGKSAIALGILLLGVIIAVARLHSDNAILIVVGLGVVAFFGWFLYVLKFAGDHPDIALLEGAEWTGFQRFQAEAKGYIPGPSEKQPTALPGAKRPLSERQIASLAAETPESPIAGESE